MRTRQQVECNIKNLQQTLGKLKYELQEIKKNECYYHVGQWFELHDSYCARKGVLSCIGVNMVALICISKRDSNRWHEPICVGSTTKITQEEFDKITSESGATLISNPLFCKEN